MKAATSVRASLNEVYPPSLILAASSVEIARQFVRSSMKLQLS